MSASDKTNPILPFEHTYAALPEAFYRSAVPTPVKAPQLIRFNTSLATELGLESLQLNNEHGTAIFSGNQVAQNSKPIAMAYAGHQFGQFVPTLGDGRAILLGEIRDQQQQYRDIQLKGAGRTPFSRRGDGRATLGAVMREYILSEAMHALGVPTTRALAFITTGELVFRETALPGAILTRVAASHIRIGTFEYFAAKKDISALQQLTDYVIKRHYPELSTDTNPALGLLTTVCRVQAELIANWLSLGFIHGVMNTDNMTLSGETIDYGPCAFMEAYDPKTVFSSIDVYGRYAYNNQPVIGQWNLASLGECLLPLIDQDTESATEQVREQITAFEKYFAASWLQRMRLKLGLGQAYSEDIKLIRTFLDFLQQEKLDYTLAFRQLADIIEPNEAKPVTQEYPAVWLANWQQRLLQEGAEPAVSAALLRKHNPAFIPRNHRVEQAIQAAIEKGDFSLMTTLLQVLANPYVDQPEYDHLMQAAAPHECVMQTFCGT